MILRCVRTLSVLLAVVLITAASASAQVRVLGSVGAQMYAHEDIESENHIWLLQTTRASVYLTGTPWSVHASGGYVGDWHDDFSESGEGRFYKGYVQYGGLGQALNVRAGRFFLYRGVALGVFDGADVSYRVNPRTRVALFGGLMGPYNRQFEFSDPAKATAFGAEVAYTPANCLIAEKGTIKLSYARQNREDETFRHLIGLQTHHRFSRALSWFNTIHLRPGGDLLRKWISRARYVDHTWNGMVEFGVLRPEVPTFSWFSDFDMGTGYRVRTAVTREVNDWMGIGVEAQVLMRAAEFGFRGGPMIAGDWGQIGYRVSGGEHAITNGPWASLRYSPMQGVELYAHGAMVSYEWDAFDIASEDLTMVFVGTRYTPSFMESVSARLEYQLYQTPQLDQDARVLAGLAWNFDTGRAR